jgi:RNA polymerase sigma factor (TIGR02999 family)
MSNVTQLLVAAGGDDPKAAEELLKAIYGELRIMAKSKMALEKPGHTLQPTVLVNDVWLKLFPEGNSTKFESRAHFFGTASVVMHRILVDHARHRLAQKRGGKLKRAELSETQFAELTPPATDEVIMAVDEALKKFEKVDPATASLVNLRFFAGLSMKQAAEALNVSLRSAERDYAYFSAWFRREFGNEMEI